MWGGCQHDLMVLLWARGAEGGTVEGFRPGRKGWLEPGSLEALELRGHFVDAMVLYHYLKDSCGRSKPGLMGWLGFGSHEAAMCGGF
jgi:hypothetical protein